MTAHLFYRGIEFLVLTVQSYIYIPKRQTTHSVLKHSALQTHSPPNHKVLFLGWTSTHEMSMSETRDLTLTAFTGHGRKETDMFTGMTQPFVIVGRTGFVQLIDSIFGQCNTLRNIADTIPFEFGPQLQFFLHHAFNLIQQQLACLIRGLLV